MSPTQTSDKQKSHAPLRRRKTRSKSRGRSKSPNTNQEVSNTRGHRSKSRDKQPEGQRRRSKSRERLGGKEINAERSKSVSKVKSTGIKANKPAGLEPEGREPNQSDNNGKSKDSARAQSPPILPQIPSEPVAVASDTGGIGHVRGEIDAKGSENMRSDANRSGNVPINNGEEVGGGEVEVLKDQYDLGTADTMETLETMREHAQEFDDDVLFRHVDLYVNEWTIDLGTVGSKALNTLSQRAKACGLMAEECPNIEVWSPNS